MKHQRHWYKGDTHLHTTNSDGVLSLPLMTAYCRKRGLDWAIITDHNYYSVESPYEEDGLLVIPGEEITAKPGHFNLWGAKAPMDPPYTLETFEDYKTLINAAKEVGAIGSVNHPFCKKCGWHLPLEGFEMDCVEVWNAPQHLDNMTNIRWWHEQLLKGRRIAAVGGSDYHKDYYVTRLVAMPTTICYAASKSAGDILAALRGGHSVITQGPHKTMVYMTCGDAFVGQSVAWEKGISVDIKAVRVKPGHRVVVYNNDRVIYDRKVLSGGTHEVRLEVPEKGFVRVEVLYEYKHIAKVVYKAISKKMAPLDAGLPLPPFVYCLTNPLFFE